ncbi:hypothetical protein RM780_03920 [Streptomyces sp. DSM 44917]|uniref:DUF7739 domain-containing protein n=1 Tax=Streptomyces boetiae TaxID=3075541 RepID=A0ABU2L3G8_9ACTN|nr:hypothetical protein [Streptomyces sp. DSM 44917]MDT0306110.1 hypothetical protein [Streptomyces sp. DSM 44917]
MGWNIQHLDHTRSYTQIANLMRHAERELTVSEFRPLAPLAEYRTDCWIELTNAQAGQIRDALHLLAQRLRSKRFSRDAHGWAIFARDLAQAADTAHRTGRPWRWS